VVECRPGEGLDVVARHDDLEAVLGTDLVGEVGLQELLEAEVVAEVLACGRGDPHPQAELGCVGLFVTEFGQVDERIRRDVDDRLARVRVAGLVGECFEGAHPVRLPPRSRRVAALLAVDPVATSSPRCS